MSDPLHTHAAILSTGDELVMGQLQDTNARWIAERKASLVGADSCCVEVDPNPDAKLDHPVHQELIMRNGILMLENLDLRGLAAERVYEFLFIFTPTPFKGASGSPGRPLAIR